MESKKSKTGHYNSLIWLLLTSYTEPVYTPSKFIMDTLLPDILRASDLEVTVLDSTLYDFRITKDVKTYLDLLNKTTSKFENALLIVSYTNEDLIIRDCYLAQLAKLYTCWDAVYIDCPCPEKITTNVFDHIIKPKDLPSQLKNIINREF